jgi:hypothetical protein
MSETPRRRWFQFGIREIFWLTLVVALALFGMLERQRRIQGDAKIEQMQEARRKLEYLLREPGIIRVHDGERIKL